MKCQHGAKNLKSRDRVNEKKREKEIHIYSYKLQQLWNDNFEIYSISCLFSLTFFVSCSFSTACCIIVICWHLCVNRWICDSLCVKIRFVKEMEQNQNIRKTYEKNLIGCHAQITVSEKVIRGEKENENTNDTYKRHILDDDE